ncbi:SAM-dependent methyltransferase [Actinopolymorpha alba]|uniref:SAM-dependent methyltransferase n=1 Tax=Actinopolymorpha alba TaxID=533267 RepID=UPI00037F70A4|nr:SAM-dependent methyltransferase [Actinopolymorpha alba]
MFETEKAPADNSRTMSVARIYDYLLGGSNHREIDRQAAEQIKLLFPELEDWAWCNRGFHQRAARWLTSELGISQFLDIGSGLPTQNNTHEVVQAINPAARVVYVDNDPMVAEQATKLLQGVDGTVFIPGDLRDSDSVFSNPELRQLIDFSEPVGLLMTAVVHFVSDKSDPWRLVARCLDKLSSGSYLVLSQGTYDKQTPEVVDRATTLYQNANEQLYPRGKAEVERFFEGLELLPPYEGAKPGVTFGGLWGAEDPELADDDASRALYAGVARKP